MFLLQITRPLLPVQTNAWDRTLADWIRRGEEATRDYEAVRLNEIDMENGLYRYRVNSVFGSKYALTDDEVVTPQDDLGAQVGNPGSCVGTDEFLILSWHHALPRLSIMPADALCAWCSKQILMLKIAADEYAQTGGSLPDTIFCKHR